MTVAAPQFRRAVEKHEAGEFAEAESLYRRLLQKDPRQAEVLKLLGVLCSQTDRGDQALHFLQRAVTVAPQDPASHVNLGTALRKIGRLEDAAVEYQAAIELKPGHTLAHQQLADVYGSLNRADDAVASLRSALETEPSWADGHRSLAERFESRGCWNESVEHRQAAVDLDPAHVADRIDLGITLHRLGRLEEAIAAFTRATEVRPDLAAVWCNLGGTLRASGRVTDAISALHRAQQLDDSLLAVHTNLALAHMDDRNLPAAMAACHRALEMDPRNVGVHHIAYLAMFTAGEYDIAENHIRVAIELDPTNASYLVDLGDLLRRVARFTEAIDVYDAASRMNPANPDAVAGRIEVDLQTGNKESALQRAEQALARFSNEHTIAFAASLALSANDRHREAAELLERQIAQPGIRDDQKSMILFNLGDAYDRRGEYDSAWRSYDEGNRLKRMRVDRDSCLLQMEAIRHSHSRKRLASRPRAAAGPLRPIFIAGMPRSGTTLVEQILDSHPEVVGGGEMSLLGRIIGRIPTMTDAQGVFPECTMELDADALGALAAFGWSELRAIAGNSSCVVEKTPLNFLYLGLIELLFPEARVIVCRRDPLDCSLSCYFHDFSGEHTYAYSLEDLGWYHRQFERVLAHWDEALTLPLMNVHYEDLVADQEGVTSSLLSFLDLPWHDDCLRFFENRRVARTASHQQVREPIYTRSVNRHEHYAKYLAPLRAALAKSD